jgi:hypothetical protein
VIEVYAITDRPDAALPAAGRLRRATHGPIAAVYSPIEERPAPTSTEALWRHESLVESLMADRAVLPMRYGTVLEDEWRLRRELVERSEEFSRLLNTVRGRVELALRVVDDGKDQEVTRRAGSGREYMEARLRTRRRGEEVAAMIRPLERMAEASRRREAASADVARWAFLVRRELVDDFRARLEELRASHPELPIICTGPWPPYSFVSGGNEPS